MGYGGFRIGLLIGLSALLGLQCLADSTTAVCDLAAVQDRVTHASADQSTSRVVAVSEHVSVSPGERIKVDARGLARLEFPDLVTVEVFRDSHLKLRKKPARGDSPLVDVFLETGAVFCDMTPREHAYRRVVVGTEWAQIQAIGTSFIVQCEPGTQVTRIGVLQGEVMVAGQDQGVIATGGQLVQVEPGQPPTWPETDAGYVLQWLEYLRTGRPLATSTPTSTPTGEPTPTPVPSATRLTWPSPSVTQPTVYVSPTRGPCPRPPRPYWIYTVSRGDTLSGLAQRFHTSVETLMRNNCLTSSLIYAGQRLYIPGYQPTRSPSPTPPTPSPSPTPPIHAFITHVGNSFTKSGGILVVFRIVNAPDGATLECAQTHITCGDLTCYGPTYSNEPFYSSKSGADSLAPGVTAQLRYRLACNPGQQYQGMVRQSIASVPCRATFTLYTADNMGGASASRTVNFALSGGATITPSPTPSATSSPTPSATPSPTPSVTPSPRPSETPTATATIDPGMY